MNIWLICFYFFVYAILGWILEVLYQLLKKGHFVNRGMLNGPYCPIYAFGAIGMLIFLQDYKDQFWHIFLGAALFGSILELVGGFLIDKIFNLRFWDYSDCPFNIGGYICLRFSVYWGFIGLFFNNYIHPLISSIISLIPNIIIKIIVCLSLLAMLTDFIITIAEILGFKKLLYSLAKQKNILKSISDNFGKNITKTTINLGEKIKNTKESLQNKNIKQLTKAKQKAFYIKEILSYRNKRFFKVFPQIKSKNKYYNEIILELKKYLKL